MDSKLSGYVALDASCNNIVQTAACLPAVTLHLWVQFSAETALNASLFLQSHASTA